ncbi:MAG: 2TM domain-containing protein [Maribacter sp.]
MADIKLSKFERAQERVEQLKKFYNHATVYVIINVLLFLFRGHFRFTLISEEALGNPDFLSWIDWNVFGTAIVWGIFLVFHGIKVFGKISVFGRKWEERKLQEFMNEEE